MTADSAAYWDEQADSFDNEPDHGLRDPATRHAWSGLLSSHLPPAPSTVADLGCGTGSLSCLLAGAGYDVVGVDVSPRMVTAARAKAAAAGLHGTFMVGDAADPDLLDGSFDVVLVRHVLWALPDPDAALGRWVRLLTPPGRLVLIEGRWQTGGGLSSEQAQTLVSRHRRHLDVHPLTDPQLWGGPICDERYLLISQN